MADDHHCGHGALSALLPFVVVGAVAFGLLLALNPASVTASLAGLGGGAVVLGVGSAGAGFLVTLWILLFIVGGLAALVAILLRQPGAIVKWLLERFPVLRLFLRGVRDGGKVMEAGGVAAGLALNDADAGLRKAIEELQALASYDGEPWASIRALSIDDPITGPLRTGVNRARDGINTAVSGLEDARAQLRAMATDQVNAGGALKTAAETLDPTLRDQP